MEKVEEGRRVGQVRRNRGIGAREGVREERRGREWVRDRGGGNGQGRREVAGEEKGERKRCSAA